MSKKNFRPDEDGTIELSANGHYKIVVVPREEQNYPNSTIPRYEIINLSTLAVEARVANLHMAVLIMNEYDKNMEQLVTGELDDTDEPQLAAVSQVDFGPGSTH